MNKGLLLLLRPGEVRRKREEDFGRIGPVLFAGTNISDPSISKISLNWIYLGKTPKKSHAFFHKKEEVLMVCQ